MDENTIHLLNSNDLLSYDDAENGQFIFHKNKWEALNRKPSDPPLNQNQKTKTNWGRYHVYQANLGNFIIER